MQEPCSSRSLEKRTAAPRPCAAAVCLGITALVAVAGMAPRAGDAAAWTRAQGSGLLSVPGTYTRADESFDADGDRQDSLEFEMVEIAPLFELGLLDSTTLGLQPKYRSVEVETAEGGKESNSGLAEADVYLRQNLWSEGDAAFSVQALVKVPIDPQENDPAAGAGPGRRRAEPAVRQPDPGGFVRILL